MADNFQVSTSVLGAENLPEIFQHTVVHYNRMCSAQCCASVGIGPEASAMQHGCLQQ